MTNNYVKRKTNATPHRMSAQEITAAFIIAGWVGKRLKRQRLISDLVAAAIITAGLFAGAVGVFEPATSHPTDKTFSPQGDGHE